VGDGGQTVGPFIAPGAGRRGSAWAAVRRQRNGEQWQQHFQLASEVTRTRKIGETGTGRSVVECGRVQLLDTGSKDGGEVVLGRRNSR
jgi:hypothetical protein